MIRVKSVCCDAVICEGPTLKDALERAVRDGVSLMYADLRDKWLVDMDLRDSDLRYADLSHSFFRGSTLRGADISHASIGFTKFYDADLRGMCHTGIRIPDSQMIGARCNGMWVLGTSGSVARSPEAPHPSGSELGWMEPGITVNTVQTFRLNSDGTLRGTYND